MALGLYIHIPFCTAKCSYCDFASFSASLDIQKQYVSALISEIDGAKHTRTCDTIFIGGGTPSALYNGGLTEIFNALKRRFRLNLKEFTVEANPETVTPAFIKECVGMGVNRLSLGLQTTSNALLKGLRGHTYQDFLSALSLAKSAGINNFNADLMLGLNGQTLNDVTNSVSKLMDLGLNHISVYALKVEQGTPLFKSGYRPDDDTTADFYDAAHMLLRQKYTRYEVSNFALAGYECLHNQKYWNMSPYLGLGLNASSFYSGVRRKNTSDLSLYLQKKYFKSTQDVLKDFDKEYTMLALRTAKGIDLKKLKNPDLLLKNPKTEQFLRKNVLISKNNRLFLHDNYFYLMNQVIIDLI